VLTGLQEIPATRRLLKLVLLAAAAGCIGVAVIVLRGVGPGGTIYLVTAVLLIGMFGAFLVARFARVARGVRGLGYALVAATCVALLVDAKRVLPHMSTLPE